MRVIGKTWPDQTPQELKYVLPEWNNPKAWPIVEKNGA